MANVQAVIQQEIEDLLDDISFVEEELLEADSAKKVRQLQLEMSELHRDLEAAYACLASLGERV